MFSIANVQAQIGIFDSPPGNYLIPKWIIKRDSIHHIPVSLEGEQFVSSNRVPDLARAIVRACDELVAGFIEGAVCQGEDVSSQNLKQVKVVALLLF